MSQASEQQASRTRFSFGPVWTKNVIEGKVKDEAKLRAHAVKLKVGSASDIKRLKFETLRAKVAAALQGIELEPAKQKGAAKRTKKASAAPKEGAEAGAAA